ncbi:hypothetical protein ACT7DZ_12320 [Bacillus cereus]
MGRYKDVIIRGGDNVYPDQVEDVIHEIHGVLEVAVVGVPDDFWRSSKSLHCEGWRNNINRRKYYSVL